MLPGFNLDIPAGQTIALVGTTGAGKSTLAKLVSRLYDPSVGRVALDGIDLRDLSNLQLRRAIVMVTQEAYLFSGSVAENIALGKPDATTDEILGAHIVGPMASELIAECVVAMEFRASSEDLARICHAHPSLSESTKEACLAVDKRTLNF